MTWDAVWISPHPLELPGAATGAGVTLTVEQLETALDTARNHAATHVQIHVARDGSRAKVYTFAGEPSESNEPTDCYKVSPQGSYE